MTLQRSYLPYEELGVYYRKSHEIIGSTAGAVTDYQIRIIVHYGEGTDDGEYVYLNGKCKTDFGDIRFKDSGGNPLSYWMEEKVDGDHAVFWVKVPNIPANPNKTTIYIYYGDPTKSTTSNGTETFLLFDDIEVWSGWVQYGDGQVSQDSARKYDGQYSAHKTTANDPNGAYKEIGMTIGRDIVFEFWVNRNSGYSGGHYDQVLLVDNEGNGYNWFFRHDEDKIGIMKRDGYSLTELASSSATEYMDKWVFAQFIIKSDGTIIARRYVDGALNGEVSTSETTYSSFTRVHIGGGYDYWVDQIRIRKYVDPEPSHGSWGSEEVVEGGY